MEYDVRRINKWLKMNKLKLNENKMKILEMNINSVKVFKINDFAIEKLEHIKYVGFVVDEK